MFARPGRCCLRRSIWPRRSRAGRFARTTRSGRGGIYKGHVSRHSSAQSSASFGTKLPPPRDSRRDARPAWCDGRSRRANGRGSVARGVSVPTPKSVCAPRKTASATQIAQAPRRTRNSVQKRAKHGHALLREAGAVGEGKSRGWGKRGRSCGDPPVGDQGVLRACATGLAGLDRGAFRPFLVSPTPPCSLPPGGCNLLALLGAPALPCRCG